MKSSANFERQPRELLTDANVRNLPALPAKDPIQAYIDLIEVMRVLCPQWPERRIIKDAAGYRL